MQAEQPAAEFGRKINGNRQTGRLEEFAASDQHGMLTKQEVKTNKNEQINEGYTSEFYIQQHTHTIEIWLILPVVICLFQGLSHACLRITALQESAHGSLHQT